MLTGAIKITQSRKNTEIRIRRTTSENWETLTTTRVPWITKLNSTKTPPTLRRGGLLIRLHLLQLVGFLEYFILDSIAEHGSQQIPQALLWQALGMLHDFIKYTLVLSCLLVIINLGDLNKSSRSRIASSGSKRVFSVVLWRVWIASDTDQELDWSLPPNF